MPTCPNCGHCWKPTPSVKSRSLALVDTAILSDTELHAYYKRTSHIGDVLFYLAIMNRAVDAEAISIRQDCEQLLILAQHDNLSKKETLNRLWAIKTRWFTRHDLAKPNETAFWVAAANRIAQTHIH